MTDERRCLSRTTSPAAASSPRPANAPPRYRGELMRLMAIFVDSELAGCRRLRRLHQPRPRRHASASPPPGSCSRRPTMPSVILRLMEQFGADDGALRQRPSLGRPPATATPISAPAGRGRHAPRRLPLPDHGWIDAVVLNVPAWAAPA